MHIIDAVKLIFSIGTNHDAHIYMQYIKMYIDISL